MVSVPWALGILLTGNIVPPLIVVTGLEFNIASWTLFTCAPPDQWVTSGMWATGYFLLQRCILCTQLRLCLLQGAGVENHFWCGGIEFWQLRLGQQQLADSKWRIGWNCASWLWQGVCRDWHFPQAANAGTKSYRWRRNGGWGENLWSAVATAVFSVRGSFSQPLSPCRQSAWALAHLPFECLQNGAVVRLAVRLVVLVWDQPVRSQNSLFWRGISEEQSRRETSVYFESLL